MRVNELSFDPAESVTCPSIPDSVGTFLFCGLEDVMVVEFAD